MTNEKFKSAIADYLVYHPETNKSKLARDMGQKRENLRNWLKVGIVTEKRREEVVQTYPWLFSSNGSQSNDLPNGGEVEEQSLPPAAAKPNPARELQIVVKTQFAWRDIACLSEILIWFLFNATREEREQFREDLGDAWKEFLNLTRAMTGETAFRIAKEEGRLQRWEQ
jgi:hypothetical protein